MDFFFVLLNLKSLFLELLLLLGQLHTLRSSGVFDGVREVSELGAVALLLLVNIVGTHPGKKVTLVAVHIDQRLEAVLLAAVEEPVDRTLLIGFQMVGIEVIQEVAADNFAGHTLAAERICDELEVFFQRFLAVDSFHPLHKPSGDVIVEVVIIADGDDIVRVNRERLVVSLIDLVIIGAIGDRTVRVLLCELLKLRIIAVKRPGGLLDFAVPSKNQTGLVQRIPPEHTAHGIRDEGDDLVSHGADVVAALHGLRHIIFTVKHAMHGHILVRHIRRQFVLQAVNVNENAVKFFFVLFKLLETVFTFLFPCGVGSGQVLTVHKKTLFEIP